MKPDGIMLSNGPGDPADNIDIIGQIQIIQQSQTPLFGICLGHQLLALANGAQTKKLKYGHRGSNQPVIQSNTGKVYISSQNHGYYVVKETLPNYAEVSYLNVNDDTCEGVVYHNSPAFSVQYHPEAAGGPLDTEFLFDEFISMMKGAKNHAAQ
jgi:carbamoyl-phosphate synthase small subunit